MSIFRVGEQNNLLDLAFNHWGLAKASFQRAEVLETWERGEQLNLDRDHERNWDGQLYQPRETSGEYKDLLTRSPGAWGGLVVKSMSQTAYVTGIRRAGERENLPVWEYWKLNGMDSRQIPLHRGALGQGMSFACVERGTDPLTGRSMPRSSLYSAKRMCAFYGEERDDWPMFALWAKRVPDDLEKKELGVWNVMLVDEVGYHTLTCKNDGDLRKDWAYVSSEFHNFRVPPVVRYVGESDLENRATGLIEPVIPLLRRIDQDTFDRLIVQRFGAWKVRWISGMAKPDSAEAEMMLRIQDFMASEDPNTKFGTLPETQIAGFLESAQNDLRELSALSQIPPHHLLGLSDNLQAEALAAAETGLQRRSLDFRTVNGEAHERHFRLLALAAGGMDDIAGAWDLEVQWRDTESRSFVQAVQALGMAAQQLGVPVQMLWEKIPNWTDTDVQRAKELVESGKADQMIAAIQQSLAGAQAPMDQGEARRNAAGQ